MIKQKMLEPKCIKRACVHAQKIIQFKIMPLVDVVQLLIDCILLIFYNRLENLRGFFLAKIENLTFFLFLHVLGIFSHPWELGNCLRHSEMIYVI